MSLSAALHGYLRLTRLSNLPTVVSGALVGCAMGAGIDPVPWGCVVGSAVALSLFYVAGMTLNDLADLPWDRTERTDRPLVDGMVSRRGAWTLLLVCAAAGLVILSRFDPHALGLGGLLLSAIVAYDLLHKIFPPAVLLMGVCRAMVYVVAAATVSWPFSPVVGGLLAGGIFWHTTLLILAARKEDDRSLGVRRWLVPATLFGALPASVLLWPSDWTWSAAAAAALALWVAWATIIASQHPRRAIMALLSAMCLLDALFLTLLEQPALAGAAAGCFALTALAHLRLSGT